MEQFMTIMFELLEGFGNTLLLFIITLVLALPLGLLFAFGSIQTLTMAHENGDLGDSRSAFDATNPASELYPAVRIPRTHQAAGCGFAYHH